MTAACVAAVLSFTSIARGQASAWKVMVDGTPLPLSRPVASRGKELFVPLLPVTRALGFQVEFIPEFNGLRLRRGTGAPIEYDGRTGEIRFGPVVAGQLLNYQRAPISPPLDELLFPVDGLITLLAVDVQLDAGTNAIYINSSRDPLNVPSASRVGVSSLDYSLGITQSGGTNGHYTLLRSNVLGGGIPLSSSFLLSGEGAAVRLQQGTVVADMGRHRALTAGDQSAVSGVDSLTSSIRGLSFASPFKGFEASAYAGRAASSVRAQMGAPGVADYDSTIIGGALRKKSLQGDLSFAANSFTGPDRTGSAAGVSFAKTTARNQMKAQAVAGSFSGFSLRTITTSETNPSLSPDAPATPPQMIEQTRVQGGALGLSVFDTFTPIEPLTITAQLERYGKNFLAAREDSEFNAQTSQRVSMALRPQSHVNLYGGIMRRSYLAGDPGVMRSFNYGASGIVPTIQWLQLGYFKVVQNDTAFLSGRLKLSQYSATLLNMREYSGVLSLSDLQANGTTSRTLNVLVSRGFSSFGQLTAHDQLQWASLHRYGPEWQFSIPHGSVRLGIDRLVNLRTSDRSYAPLLGLTLKLPGNQRLVATYSGERGTHILNVVITGPLVHHEDLRRDDDGRVRIVSQASLEGRVYLDSDGDGAFSPESDKPMTDITVWLDGKTSVVTDAKGAFRFDHVISGTHGIRADLADVPADMVFADSGERRVAILPFRDNVQDFAIVRTGSLSGKVTFLDYSEDPEQPVQKPMAEARIIADNEHDTYSDLSGNIAISSLKPGTYQLKVDPETTPSGYIASVVPQEVHVKAGEALRGVQIRLEAAPRAVTLQELPTQESITLP